MTTVIENTIFIKTEPEEIIENDDDTPNINFSSDIIKKEKIENTKTQNSKSNKKNSQQEKKKIKEKVTGNSFKQSKEKVHKETKTPKSKQNEINKNNKNKSPRRNRKDSKNIKSEENIEQNKSSKIKSSSNTERNSSDFSLHPVQAKEKISQLTFNCSICDIIFDSKQKWATHMKIHQEPTHQCPKCDRKFKSEKNIAKHECAICSICGHKSASKSELKIHIKQEHNEAANKIYTVQCDYCGKYIKTKTYLIHHIRALHVKDEKSQLLCTLCGSKVRNKFLLDKHMLIEHSEMISCKLCGKMVKPLCMPYHMRQVHASERNFVCTVCFASFKTLSNFKDHMKTHNKSYACDLCDKVYARPDHLREHRILHYDPNAYSCQVCDRHFTTKGYLQRHMKAHEESNLKCKICGVDVNALSLHYHMKNSHPLDRFKCHKCDATGFATQREFSEHLRIHEKERVEIEQITKENSKREKKNEIMEREKEEMQAIANIKAQNNQIESFDKNNEENLANRKNTKELKKFNIKRDEKVSKNYRNKNELFEKKQINLQQTKETKSSIKRTKEAERNQECRKVLIASEENLEESQDENSFDGFENEADNIDWNYDSPNELLQQEIEPQIIPKIEIKEEKTNSVTIEQIQNLFDTISKPRKRSKKIKSLEPQPRFILIPKNSIVTCDLCGENFNKKKKLISHLRQHLRENEINQCQICFKIFATQSILEIHMRSHIEMTIPCEICGKQVKPQCMINHIRQVHTTIKTLECEICGKLFKTKQNLREHLKHHNKAFQCAVCGRKFPRSTDLKEHMISHDNPEALECPHCKLRLADRRLLTKHIANLHLERSNGIKVKQEKKYKCELCDYSCIQKGNLKIHYKRHEKYEARLRANPDALKCEICEALFKSELILKIHMQKVHSEERFPCEHCGKVLKTNNSLWSHLRKIHQVEPEKKKKKEKPVKIEGEKKKRRKRRKRNEAGELVEREEIENAVNVIEVHSVNHMEFY